MKQKRYFLAAALELLLFVGFTALVSLVDVQPIGPEGSEVGLATLNEFVHEMVGYRPFWYSLTQWLGVLSLLVAVGFGLVGLVQLVQRKSLKKVDPSLLALGGFYVLVLLCYVLFEVLIVNYRPMLQDGVLEASYPSSHTMLVICVMATARMELRRLMPKSGLRVTMEVLCGVLITVMVLGRYLSGVHWFTDIIGGIFLASALVTLYAGVLRMLPGSKKRN